ncbi:pyruvate phosphate dikinase [Chloropicon primus]|uniref:Pyruvate phosphate dikinase n=1 Tax=Chloropicon primus TaxID=1764295 RepID=A0A5B8MTK5_9CHLO|nr:pyruvate phosphate dikinase [Chloropicon primus]UPR01984.1 pyruvate phosphate dikinase [Chloropicon primus]|eukprot:QDZ22760.1 pyruvate phosphate dikinase [Chloropicon primus]
MLYLLQLIENEMIVSLEKQTRTVQGKEVPLKSYVNPSTGDVEVLVDAGELEDLEGLELHWAVQGPEGREWSLPPSSIRPENSRDFGDGKALRTPPTCAEENSFRFVIPRAASEETGVTGIVGILVSGENWLHGEDGKGDLSIPTCAPDPNSNAVVERAAAEEAVSGDAGGFERGGIGLFRRYQLASELLDEARAGAKGAGAMLAWIRLSANRQLQWYTSGNYQGKDMASLQKSFAENVAGCVSDGRLDPLVRHLFRNVMATLPRGGGNGDDIRMGILNILRTHGIKEGHRPGIEDTFLAQWHQKLHSSTTVDDIAICEAYLHFLRTGMWDDFWGHLWDHGGLSREDLGAMKVGWKNNSGITGPANHMPHMIPDFEHLLWILKVTHSGGDLDTAMTMARGHLPDDVAWEVDDLLQNRDAWWVPGKIVEIRSKLADQWKNPGCPRDVLLLDICLESFLRTKIEQIDLYSLSDDDVISVAELALRSGTISTDDPGLVNALHLWQRMMSEESRWSEEWARAADSALEYLSISLGKFMDGLTSVTQPAAEAIGQAAKVPDSYILNFGEEIVRGHPLFVLSGMINRLQKPIKAASGGSTWNVVSPLSGDAKGEILVENLSELQGESFEAAPIVLLSEGLGGLEDIPEGVVAVLTASPIDILSHIAIRARNTGVFLASCSDTKEWEAMSATGKGVPAKVCCDSTTGKIFLEEIAEAELLANGKRGEKKVVEALKLIPPEKSENWVLTPSEYKRGVVGGKSFNLGALHKISKELSGVTTPSSFSLPFGSFEKALESDGEADSELKDALKGLKEAAGGPEEVRRELEAIRSLVGSLSLPEELRAELQDSLQAGLEHVPGSEMIEGELWEAVKSVWASKWTERAYLSRKACGIAEEDLSMAVLLMDLVPAEYAFVLHTTNPISLDANEVFGEIVVGLGEALVGNDPGKALSFLYNKESESVKILTLPSKPTAYFAPEEGSVIARSDSNGEDLESFAGAGLYDSVATLGTVASPVNYSNEPLMWDAQFQEELATRIAKIALQVEGHCGTAQDIEGAIRQGEVYLLQSRNQVVA